VRGDIKMTKYYALAKKRMLERFLCEDHKKDSQSKGKKDQDMKHAFEVEYYCKKLWGNKCPEALLIAGLYHDYDRIFKEKAVDTKNCAKERYFAMKIIHSANSAMIFREHNPDLPIDLIQDVTFLICRHEIGGDVDKEGKLIIKKDSFTQGYNLNKAANIIWYADKISFFKSNIDDYSKRGEEELMKKIRFSIVGLPKEVIKIILDLKLNKKVKKLIKKITK
jgi:HD superfamily phosphohydrolase YqeK